MKRRRFRCCAFCGDKKSFLLETRDGKNICVMCAERENFCEICGSTLIGEQTADEQLHYEEECFK